MEETNDSRPAEHATALSLDESRRYRMLLNATEQGFCVLQVSFDAADRASDFRFLEANGAFERQTGLRAVVGRSMRELAPSLERPWYDAFGNVARTGRAVHMIEKAQALDDRWLEVHAFRLDEPGANRVGAWFENVTARTRAERNRRVLGEIADALLHLNYEGELPAEIGGKVTKHLHASQCSFVELDWHRGVAVVSKCWCEPGVPSPVGEHALDDFVREEIWQDARQGKTLVIDDVGRDPRIANPDRFHQLEVSSFVAVPLMRHGEWRYLFTVNRQTPSAWRKDQIEFASDVATRCWERLERLRAEAALRASEERLRLMVENAREYAIFAIDLRRRVTSWSAGAERLLGYSEAEIVGRSGDELFTPDDRKRGAPESEAAEALAHGRASNERWHRRKDGSMFWGSGVTTAMRPPGGDVCGLVKVLRDESDSLAARLDLERSQRELREALRATEEARADAERARQQAEGAGRAKDQFLATLSHELRTPLNPVLMIASEDASDPAVPPELRADFATICKNVELEARLIDDMLDMTRIAHGKLSLRRVEVDVHHVVTEALEMVRQLVAEKGITLSPKLEASRTRMLGDPARLEQVFTNLLNNAIKFTPSQGHIVVQTSNPERAEEIWVRVEDDGIGLTPAEIARVFQPFMQGSHVGEPSRGYGGLGLGLTIAHDWAARHGGRVTASSAGRGQGATFIVHLPLATAAAADPSAAQPSVEVGAARRLQVLLVEDHLPTRVALERMLNRRGHVVTAVGTKKDALAAGAGAEYDLLISDIGLPDGDGAELLGELRQIRPRLRAIALSGFGMDADLRRSSDVGFATHLVKPVSMSKLDAAIAQTAA